MITEIQVWLGSMGKSMLLSNEYMGTLQVKEELV